MDRSIKLHTIVLHVALLAMIWACCSLSGTEATPSGLGRHHPHRHHLRPGYGGGSSSSNRLTRHHVRPSAQPQFPAEFDWKERLTRRQDEPVHNHHQDAREEFDDDLEEFLGFSNNGDDDLDNHDFEDLPLDDELDPPKVGCKNCAQRKAEAERVLTPEEIKQIRIEDIKRQILRKLRMKARPNVTIPRNLLPTPLSDGEISLKGPGHHQITKDIEDYYGKTEQVIIFPEQNRNRCFGQYHHSSACLYFSLASDIPDGEVTSAELWVYKLKDRRDVLNQSFSVADLPADNQIVLKKRNFVAHRETSIKTGWVKFNVKQAVKRWLLRPHLVSGLEVICRTCGREYDVSPISDEAGQRPFLVLTTNSASSEERRRTKRSTNCGSETSHCCREELFVSFHDIGWDDWIIQPRGYRANYCKGSCLEDVALPLSNSHHVTVMQRYIQKRTLDPALKEQLMPCCTPTRMSSVSLLYMNEDKKLFQKNLPNMVVDACGCS